MPGLGIQCPNCQCLESTQVVNTQPAEDGRLRYRRCVACGKTFVTMETVEPERLEKLRKEKLLASAREQKKAAERFKKLTEN